MNSSSTHTIRRSKARLAATIAGGTLLAAQCLAADRSWSSEAGGNFTTSTNWLNGIVAGVNDVANFRNSTQFPDFANYTITFNTLIQNQSLRVQNDFVTFDLANGSYRTTSLSGNEIGTVGTGLIRRAGSLTIRNGPFTVADNSTLTIGAVATAFGTLALSSNGVLNGSPRLIVGVAGAFGTLSVNSGTLTASLIDLGSGAGATGNAVFTLPFSTITSGSLIVGNAGAGTMSINTGALYTNNGTATIGNVAGGSGLVIVDTTGRWIQTGTLVVGGAGAGSVTISGGGTVSCNAANTTTIARDVGSTGRVEVSGSSRWSNGTLIVGALGNATLDIASGGFVSAGTTVIGRSAGSAGTLNISGVGSSATFGRLFVGNTGTATVNVTAGGALNAGTTVVGNSGTATLNIIGAGSSATFPRLSVADTDSGSINVSDGGLLTCLGFTDIGFTFDSPSSFGRVNVTGSGSRWINTGSIQLFSGFGNAINITGGGTAECNGAAINVDAGITVDGAGSRWVNSGSVDLLGDMTISNGGVVENTNPAATTKVRFDSFTRVQGAGSTWNIAGDLEVGNNDGRVFISSGGRVQAANTIVADGGTITVSSSGSDLTTGALTLGITGNDRDTLLVQFGGDVHSQFGHVAGPNSTLSFLSSVTVRDFGSTWQNAGSLIVGGDGTASLPRKATMDVLNSGLVTNANAFIAISPGSTGTVTVGGIQAFSPASWTTLGNLYVGGSTLSAGGSGTLIINSGGQVNVTNLLTVWNDGVVNLNGGTLDVGSIAFPGSTFIFNSGTLRITGSPTLNGPILDKLLGPTHTLSAGRHLSIAGTPALSSLLILDGGMLTVPTLAAGSPLQFDRGTFNLTSDNLTIGNVGLFGNSLTLDDRNINVTNATTIDAGASLVFQGGSFVLGGGITNNGLIDVRASAAFPNDIINNGEIRSATGAVASFIGDVSGGGSLTGPGGRAFRAGSNSSVAALDATGDTSVDSGATLSANRIRDKLLVVRGNVRINPNGTDAATSRVEGLLVFGGRLDLADNTLVIDYTAPSPLEQIGGLIQSGFAGGSWNGVGINSSIAASTPNRALGFAEAADIGSPAIFAGQPIDSTTVLVQYTLPGDADLDRTVGIGDFALLAANFNLPSSWSKGDFNYDQVTDIGDFALLAASFNQTLPAGVPRASVPEPVGAATMGLTSLASLLRRRRRR